MTRPRTGSRFSSSFFDRALSALTTLHSLQLNCRFGLVPCQHPLCLDLVLCRASALRRLHFHARFLLFLFLALRFLLGFGRVDRFATRPPPRGGLQLGRSLIILHLFLALQQNHLFACTPTRSILHRYRGILGARSLTPFVELLTCLPTSGKALHTHSSLLPIACLLLHLLERPWPEGAIEVPGEPILLPLVGCTPCHLLAILDPVIRIHAPSEEARQVDDAVVEEAWRASDAFVHAHLEGDSRLGLSLILPAGPPSAQAVVR